MSASEAVLELCAQIAPVDAEAAERARARHDQLIKPPGSLGRLEELGAWCSAVAGACPPSVPRRPTVVVCAGDHGVLAQGVTPWPAEVTATMVGQFCAERAAVNALAGVTAASVSVLDVGVAADLPRHPRLKSSRVRPGTADLAVEPAMSRDEAARALLAGAGLADQLIDAGTDLLVTGDMGIGNTTPSACLIAAFTGRPAAEVTGPGASGDPEAVVHKARVVAGALERHAPDPDDGLGTLAAIGGLEHAAVAGLILGAAGRRVPVVLDGVCTVAAALAARALSPPAVGFCVAGHRSTEPGASAGLDNLGLVPLLELGMRLGEGTGALLAVPLVQAAAAALVQMATFDEAGIAA